MTYRAHDYEVRVFWSEEDGEFVGVCDEFPHLSGLGPTREDAAREIQLVLETVLEIAEEDNVPVPPPKKLREAAAA